MNVVERETVVVPADSTSDGAAVAGIIIALVLAAVIGFMVYSFNHGTSTYVQTDTNTVHTVPVPAESPAPTALPAPSAPAPSTPAPSSSETTTTETTTQ